MKKTFLYAMLMLSCLGGYAQTGFLELKTTPEDADIYVDAAYKGKAPLFLTLSVGNHIVEVKYASYETSSLSIRINENQVNKQTIILKKVTGFKVLEEDRNIVTQPKGELTVITKPDGSEVFVDGIKADQKTPLTLTALGAGDHLVEVRNFVYQNGEYKPITISKDVHVRPNKTELLNINFDDFFGSLKVTSNPSSATIKIDGNSHGSTPATISNLSAGDHLVSVRAFLGDPFNAFLRIEDHVYINAKTETFRSYDFHKKFKAGTLVLQSNAQDHEFDLQNKTYGIDFSFKSSINQQQILTGDYYVEWEDLSSHEFLFTVSEDKVTTVYIPVKQEYLPEKRLSDHPGYLSLDKYLSKNYIPLGENKYVKKVTWFGIPHKGDHPNGLWKGSWSLAGLGFFLLFGLQKADQPLNAAGIIGITGAAISWFVLAPMNRRTVSVSLPDNIRKNKESYNTFLSNYQQMTTKWQEDTDKQNQEIRQENWRRKNVNDQLPEPSVEYQYKSLKK